MNLLSKRRSLAAALAFAGAAALISGCGGGGGGGSAAPTTTTFSTTVIDGAIKNALVCLDKNANGVCDAGEPQGKTDVAGNVSFSISTADAGKYAVLAEVGTDAIDADNGAITVPYSLTAPADRTALVNPLTTLVQQTMATTGASSAEAASAVQGSLGLNVSLFQNYAGAAAPTDGSLNPATAARLIVVATQQQTTALTTGAGAVTVGTTMTADGTVITKGMLGYAIRKRMLELLPDLATTLNKITVRSATTPAAIESALQAEAATLVADSGLKPAGLPTVVAVNNQSTSAGTTTVAVTPANGFQLTSFNFTDSSNFFARTLASSLTQSTPDANNTTRFMDRRYSMISGNTAKWSTGSDPTRQSDLSWTGTAWSACALDQENVSSVRDSQGNNTYNYCNNRETGRSSRATFDISGKKMIDVYNDMVAAGYTSFSITNAAALLGTATFPVGSSEYVQTTTPLTEAYAYYPGGDYVVGSSNVLTQYTSAIYNGGVASSQAAGTLCNSAENNTNGTNSTTFESLIAAMPGTPCVYTGATPPSFVYNSVTYTSSELTNEWWSQSTVSLGVIGTAAVGTGTTAPGFYSGNTKLRVAFKGSGANPVAYYACKERFNNGSTRNCTQIGTGSYTITTLGDARVMTFNNLPSQSTPLNFTRVLVERGGRIYSGYQNKAIPVTGARLNTVAATALLTQLGLSFDAGKEPWTPLQLNPASYRGTYDVYSPTGPTGNGTTVTLNANLTATCRDIPSNVVSNCTVNITNTATGAFTALNGTSNITGTVNFMTGAVSGTYSDVNQTPNSGSFVGKRR